MKKLILAFGAMSTLAIACGSDGPSTQSGVSGGRRLSQLNMAEATKICTYLADDLFGPVRMVTCMDGTGGDVGVDPAERQGLIDDCVMGSLEDAAEFPNCTITVQELENCYEAIIAQSDEVRYCTETTPDPPACVTLDAKFDDPTCSTPAPAAN